MSLSVGKHDARPLALGAAVAASLVVLALGIVSGVAPLPLAIVVVLTTAVSLTRPAVVPWPRLIAALILIILLIPIRRYTLPGSLPFQLEPYRIFVALLVVGWLAALLVDPRQRIRSSGFEAPLLVIAAGAFCSVVVNPAHVAPVAPEVNKSLMFLLSYPLVLVLLTSTIRRLDNVDFLAKTLVGGGAIVAVAAIVEARTSFNVFNHLSTVMPFLRDQGDVGGFQRVGTGKLRVFASAQHPIALSAVLVMLTPLALYLARRYGQRRWIACALALGIACAATISRTGIVMFIVVALVFLWLRPRETRRFWPAILPALIAIHFVLPGTLGAIKNSFMPTGGLIAQQHASANTSGSGRLADLGPALRLWSEQPLLGRGYGTQVVDLSAGGVEANIFDDQWLGTLVSSGVVGLAGWLWFFARAVRRFAAEAKRDLTERGWLLASLTAGVAAYAIGMTTYDAFAFIQVTFVLFIFIGLGSALLREPATPRPIPTGASS